MGCTDGTPAQAFHARPSPPAPCASAKPVEAARDSAAVNVSSFFMFDLLRDLLADDELKNTANVPENTWPEGDNGDVSRAPRI